MAGAFAAQASDPTAGFYNPGGLALFKKGKLTAGFAADYLNESQYQGLAPGIGEGNAGAAEEELDPPPAPLRGQAPGREIQARHRRLHPLLLQDRVGRPRHLRRPVPCHPRPAPELRPQHQPLLEGRPRASASAPASIYRSAKFSMGRRLSGFNPNAGEFQDVGSFAIDTDWDNGLGWEPGFLNKIGERFAWGVTYRSPIDIDFAGAGRLTQISTGDAQSTPSTAPASPTTPTCRSATAIAFPQTADPRRRLRAQRQACGWRPTSPRPPGAASRG